MANPSNRKYVKSEIEIDGIRIKYDACGSGTLENAKEFYEPKGYEYIGSTNIVYFNNAYNVFPKIHHFFKSIK